MLTGYAVSHVWDLERDIGGLSTSYNTNIRNACFKLYKMPCMCKACHLSFCGSMADTSRNTGGGDKVALRV